MEGSVIALTYRQVALGYIFVIIVLFMLKKRGISREKTLLFATFRMTLQLVLVGFILLFVFDNAHPLLTLGILVLMVSFAVFTIFRKFKGELSQGMKRVVMMVMPLGTLPVVFYFLWVVIRVEPYYNPQYFIPITGMIVGNSMTGISLGIQNMLKRFNQQKEAIEEALILGATPKEASGPIIDEAFDAAITPTLNSMLGMGIIFLPGMMTGQILSGVIPTMAILYQIGVMLGILGGVSLTTYLCLKLGYKTFFNASQQLV